MAVDPSARYEWEAGLPPDPDIEAGLPETRHYGTDAGSHHHRARCGCASCAEAGNGAYRHRLSGPVALLTVQDQDIDVTFTHEWED